MPIITFIIIITVLVFVHELGHFLAAKRSGIRVDEFAIGFPPKLFSWIKGETKYSINLVPFGGFVKIFGENPDDESIQGPDRERSFVNKKRHIQAFVLVAGILFNIIFAAILFSAAFMFGVPSDISGSNVEGQNPDLVITAVVKDSPAEAAGLEAGDIITSVSSGTDQRSNAEKPITPDDVREVVSASGGNPVAFKVESNEGSQSFDISPKQGISGESYAVGIQMVSVATVKLPFFQAIYQGVKTTGEVLWGTVVGIKDFLWKAFRAQADLSEVSGPVGIVGLVGQASDFGIGYLLSFTALISINLAVINLIPFPALDGGRLLFVAIEAVRRKPISPKIANTFNALGFIILIIFMIAVTTSDVSRLFAR